MKRPKKKPTLAQLRKRPALWCSDCGGVRISYPTGEVEVYFYFKDFWCKSMLTLDDLAEDLNIDQSLFVGWL
jgi:hypothetical protein